MHASLRQILAPLVLLLCVPAGAQQSLSLEAAVHLAIQRSRQLSANDAALSATRDLAVAAGRLPDPVLKAGLQNVPLSGPDRFSLNSDFMTMRNVGVMQELTGADKRRLRVQRVEADTQRLRAERQQLTAKVQREAALAWIDRHYAQATMQLIREQLQQVQLQIQGAELAYRSGRGNQADVFAGRTARASLEDRLRQAERQSQAGGLMLARWVGSAAAQAPTAGSVPWQAVPGSLAMLQQDVQDLPALRLAAAQVTAAETEVRQAEAARRPDVTLEAMYSRRGPAFPDMFSVGVSIPLPVNPGARQDREVAAKLSAAEEARARFEDSRAEQAAAVRVLLNDWTSAKERLGALRQELLPAARNRTEAALIAYGAGTGDLMAALGARRDELDARLQVLSLELETARLWAQLNFLLPQDDSVGGGQ